MATILIVDDCPEMRSLLKLCVPPNCHRVFEAADGLQALALIEKCRPDVVVLDVMMPGMDGIELCDRIRDDSPGPIMPYIIMLSAKNDTIDKVSGLDSGADAYLCKPCDPSEIKAHLRLGLRTFEERSASLTDTLTELFGRRAFDAMLEHAIARNNRHNSPLCMVMIDIDLFKAVNDTYGHSAGDAVLVTFSELFREQSRDCDLPFRWGGEEFAWLLSDTKLQGAAVATERLRTVIENHDFPYVGSLTVSIGVAELCPLESAVSLCRRADEALYRAKSDGRNCVELCQILPLAEEAS
jgi:diguanylate cyclase (GGDEF)-like protein